MTPLVELTEEQQETKARALDFATEFLKQKSRGGFADVRELSDFLEAHTRNIETLANEAQSDPTAYRIAKRHISWCITTGKPVPSPLRPLAAGILNETIPSPRKARGRKKGEHHFRDAALAKCVHEIKERFGINPYEYDLKENSYSGIAITAEAADMSGLILGRDSNAYYTVDEAWKKNKNRWG